MVAGCRIELFGGLRILLGERTITRFRTQKTAALLAFLAFHRGRAHPREALVEMLWPWASPAAGRQSLSQALSSLRHQLEPPGVPPGAVLVADHVNIQLNPQTVTTDVSEFEGALHAAQRATDKSARERDIEVAVRLYRGELLTGLYEPWIQTEQVRLSEEFIGVVVQLAKLLAERGEATAAISWLRLAIETEPLQERPYRELMRRLTEQGEHGAALKVFHKLQQVFADELGEVPSAAALGLAREVERRAKQAGAAIAAISAAQPSTCQRHPRLPTGTVTMLLLRTNREPGSKETDATCSLREEFKRHGGVEIESERSAMTVVFGHVGDALTCAAACRHRVPGPTVVTSDRAVRLTMAIHTAELAVGPDGTYPLGSFQRAERLLGAAHPAQIVCSEASAGLLRYDLNGSLRLRDLGVYRLRGASASERVFQLEYEGCTDTFPSLKAESGYSSHLPFQLTRFFGRQQEIERLRAMLAGDLRLVTMIGPPGCGKTRLAIEAATGLQEASHGAVWFVPLADLCDGADILDRTLDPLGIRRSPQVAPLDQIAAALGDEPALLVFDNFEHLIEKAGDVRSLLERLPHLRCLVTSRRRLGLTGEREFPVAPLPVPEHTDSLRDLLRNESVQLFVDRAQAVKPDFQLTAGNTTALVEICRLLEGVPLAIELAAARTNVLGLVQILERVEKGEALVGQRRDVGDRHRSLQAAVKWSYELLTPVLRLFFARLSVFRGGWTVEAAEEVCDEPLALDYLTVLVQCSLIVADASAPEPRFRMLEIVRQHAMKELHASGEADARRRRHLDYFRALTARAHGEYTRGVNQRTWITNLRADLDNVLATVEHGVAAGGEPTKVLDVGWHLLEFYLAWGCHDLGLKILAKALASGGDQEPTVARAHALNAAGLLALDIGDLREARSNLEASLAVARQVGDRKRIAGTLHNLGNVWQASDDFQTARSYYEEALAMNRELGNRAWEAMNYNALGALANDQGDLTRARDFYEKSLAIQRELGNPVHIAICLGNLASLALASKAYGDAVRLSEEALALGRSLGHRFIEAQSLHNLAGAAFRQGDPLQARSLIVEAIAIFRDLGMRTMLASALTFLSHQDLAAGNTEDARRELAEALACTPSGFERDEARLLLAARIVLTLAKASQAPAVAAPAREQAALLYGAGEAMRTGLQGPEQVENVRIVHAELRDALDGDRLDRLLVEGRSLTPDEAFALAGRALESPITGKGRWATREHLARLDAKTEKWSSPVRT